ncbi:MAG: hypothetical protein U0R76_10805 [Candidatus Nanopelagicales bacterium]
MQKLTTVLDVAGTVVLVVGVGVLAGVGWAIVATGVAMLATSWALTGRPMPRRSP